MLGIFVQLIQTKGWVFLFRFVSLVSSLQVLLFGCYLYEHSSSSQDLLLCVINSSTGNCCLSKVGV